MQEHVFEKIREWLPFVRLVGLHRFGEPFLAKNLDFYLSEYHKYGVELYTNTNLSFIPDEVEDYYDDLNLLIYPVTVRQKRCSMEYGKISDLKISSAM